MRISFYGYMGMIFDGNGQEEPKKGVITARNHPAMVF